MDEREEMQQERRICTKCTGEYPLTGKYFASYREGVFKRQCRQCERDRTKQRYQADPAAKNQQTIAYRREHKEGFNAYRRRWTANNRAMIEAYRHAQQREASSLDA